jgi:long-subunit acyl-CoA synthetase (AMP-forming)
MRIKARELFQATVRERTDEPALRTAGGEQELTPTMKLRRAPIARRYAEEIEELYR